VVTSANDAPSRIHLPDAPADQTAILRAGGVACWSEPVSIDTYVPADPDRYPLFLDRRVYQGSSGRIYPVPFTDRIATAKAPQLWEAIHLENEYVRLMFLPQIGGRIHIGVDKTNGYDFFYRNNVIKPALVGLAGPWISGGVEFNWPQHHRPGTFLPVESAIERAADGSATVWHSDLDPIQRMRATYGVRLRPGSSLIELDARLHNRTDEPQTFLWWANAAAHSHEQYQSFFPDDVTHVADHARRAITAFPRADRPYYGVDYPALADGQHPDADRIDIYSNIPVPTSYMITDTQGDFFGGYDHSVGAGFVHWADRHISPGKKQWTWGNGAIGQAWDRLLTDTDGPYVELMAGVFTDNQPDFSYLAPGETRAFSQYWFPLREIGPARSASQEVAIGIERVHSESGPLIKLGALTVSVRQVEIVLADLGGVRGRWVTEISPAKPFVTEVAGASEGPLTVRVSGPDGLLLIWEEREATDPVESVESLEPRIASVPPEPADINASDELYLTAVHLAQYRHPTRSATAYLEEALRRDPLDSRAALALGAWRFHRGEYRAAEHLFNRALDRLTARNRNPASGEASYRLGLVHERLGRMDDAADHYAKACWDSAWALPGHLALARLALQSGDAASALMSAQTAGRFDSLGPQAKHLQILALRGLGRIDAARDLLGDVLDADPLDPVALALAGRFATADPKTPVLVASDLARAGQWEAALLLTDTEPTIAAAAFGNPGPLRHYLRACWYDRLGDPAAAAEERNAAKFASSVYSFPFGLEEFDALVAAIAADPHDCVAPALLGAWYLDASRTEDARETLVAATSLGSVDPVAWRNAALATVNTGGDLDTASDLMRRAREFAPHDARLVFESDLLAELRGAPATERLAALRADSWAMDERDDVALRHVGLLLDVDDIGDVDEALTVMRTRNFQPFEGGEGLAIAAYDRAVIAVARRLLETDAEAASRLLAEGDNAPHNLGEGRHPGTPIPERLVLWGDALARSGRGSEAERVWQIARDGAGPTAVSPVVISAATFWTGIAALRLCDEAAAEMSWTALDIRADELEGERAQVDYFATSLPELLLFDLDTTDVRLKNAAELRALSLTGRSLAADASIRPDASVLPDAHRATA
jgi:tetratricopeptide (TPR) repeat protein